MYSGDHDAETNVNVHITSSEKTSSSQMILSAQMLFAHEE
jgi:hypothetical protein